MKRKSPQSPDKMIPQDLVSMTLTACLNRIMLRVSNDKYTNESREVLDGDLTYVCGKLGICPEEAVLLSFVLENNGTFSSCDDEDLASFLGCTNIEFIGYRKHLRSLSQKRIVRIGTNRSGIATYRVLNAACEAIVGDSHFSAKSFADLSTEDIFSEFRSVFKSFRDDELDADMLLHDIRTLIDANPQSLFVQQVLDSGIRECTSSEQLIFFYLCHQYVSWGVQEVEFRHLSDFVSDKEDQQRFFRFFQAGRHSFQRMSLVQFGGSEGLMDKSSAALSDKVRETFFTEVELFSDNAVSGHQDLMSYEQIRVKPLYYNAVEGEQVGRLESLLEDEHFKGIQQRLDEMGMRKGFNIILYGGPGTGKTETTLQLARKTQRDVFNIDVSKLKSKWVGDSEKAIKGVFKAYRALCKGKERKPILFFNEADAIFGKRMENVDSPVAQMLNSMQNIILQEMETLDGIMIATTNLHGNLDPAFERRFIYKVELERPGAEVRSQIWASMLPGLADAAYGELGQRYPFSGGQIENVVRKSTVDYILTSNAPTMDMVCKFCDEEQFRTQVKRVGF